MPFKAPESIGRYQVVKELKSGGMGTVFLGRDPRIGRHMGGRFVAIKVLQEFEDQELRARFDREADIAGTLDHRNIVQIYDNGEFDLVDGQLLLLCTDGLHNGVSDEQMTAILKAERDLQRAADTLVQTAVAQDGHDNVTVLLARYAAPR